MPNPLHSAQSPLNGGVHVIHNFVFADQAARLAYLFDLEDVGKVALQSSDNSFWLIVSDDGWSRLVLSGSDNPGSGGDTGASYLVVGVTSSLGNERSLAIGTGLSSSDGGANSTFALSVDGTVARISGSHFAGNISSTGTGSFALGISGSLTRLTNGASFIEAGQSITVASTSNGSILISSTATGGGDAGAQYVVLATTASLSNERVLVITGGLSGTDGGANGNFTIQAVPNEVFFVIASQMFS